MQTATVPPTAREDSGQGVWARRSDGVVDRLTSVARDMQSRLSVVLAESGDHGLRPSFAPMLQLVWDGGLAIGRIADELGISPQAASRTATLLDDLGYVERAPNSKDGRSKLVELTEAGRRVVEQGAETIARCEADYAALIGMSEMSRLVRDVTDLREGLGLAASADPVLRARRRSSIGAVILVAFQAEGETVKATAARGHVGIRAAHHDVLRLIGATGARVSEIARVQRVSRQAVSSTVQELEGHGYLARRPDPHDRRGVVFVLTDRGARLGRDSADAIDAIERRYRAILGDQRLVRFQRTVERLDESIRCVGGTAGGSRPPAPSGLEARWTGAGAGIRALELVARQLRSSLGTADAARLGALLVAGTAAPGEGRQSAGNPV